MLAGGWPKGWRWGFFEGVIPSGVEHNVHFPSDEAATKLLYLILNITEKEEGVKVSVSSLCIASCVPETKALRWIGVLEISDLIHRSPDDTDSRRNYLSLRAVLTLIDSSKAVCPE
jgi:hypothetical protein